MFVVLILILYIVFTTNKNKDKNNYFIGKCKHASALFN